jgi:hypothetical protein
VLTTRMTLIIGLALVAPTSFAEESRELPLEVLNEVLVTGTQPGPALWQVKSGANVLWVLAQVRSVAKDVKWRSKQVESVLANAREVLVVHGSGDTPEGLRSVVTLTRKEMEALVEQTRYLPQGETLRDVLPSDLYAHFGAVRAAFPSPDKNGDNDMERFTPDWARNRLWNRAMSTLKLGFTPVTENVVDMAKRRRVKVTVVYPLVWTRFSPPQEVESAMDVCPLDELLQQLDGRGASWKARANAWAVGDIERLKKLMRPPPLRRPGCEDRQESSQFEGPVMARLKEVWLTAIERSLASNSSALAVVDAPILLSNDGLLMTLRSRGYEVIEP